jgi:hypothetical protein
MAFTIPGALLLVAAGLRAVWACRGLPRLGRLALAGVVLVPVAQAGYRVVCPWTRADSDRAAAFVLDRRGTGEQVAANIWEYDYYFRHLGAAYLSVPQEGTPVRPPASGFWLVANGKNAAERLAVLETCVPEREWTVRERREFTRASVFHLVRDEAGLISAPGRAGR